MSLNFKVGFEGCFFDFVPTQSTCFYVNDHGYG